VPSAVTIEVLCKVLVLMLFVGEVAFWVAVSLLLLSSAMCEKLVEGSCIS